MERSVKEHWTRGLAEGRENEELWKRKKIELSKRNGETRMTISSRRKDTMKKFVSAGARRNASGNKNKRNERSKLIDEGT